MKQCKTAHLTQLVHIPTNICTTCWISSYDTEHSTITIHKTPLPCTTHVELVHDAIGAPYTYVQVEYLHWLVVQKHCQGKLHWVKTNNICLKVQNVPPPHSYNHHYHIQPPPHNASCTSASGVFAPVTGRKTPPVQVAVGDHHCHNLR